MSEDREEQIKKTKKIAAGIMAGESTTESISRLDVEFSKPQQYKGNRKIFDSPDAKREIKKNIFGKGKIVRDQYTGEELVLTKKEAKLRFGEDWTKHLAESDHKVPIERIHKDNKNSAWLKNDDLKEVANSNDNMEVVSRKFNNAKRSRTNEEFVNDEEYLQKTKVELSKKGKDRAIKTGREAKEKIDNKLRIKKIKNVASEACNAGWSGAREAAGITAAISTLTNIVDVVKGNKKPEEALENVVDDSLKAGAVGFALSGSLSIVGHTLSNSSSDFVKALVKANAPAKVVAAVMSTGDVLCNFAEGKISSSECIVQLGERGTAAVVASYATVIGQAAIPIPLVGAAVGALVGTAVSGAMYSSLLRAVEEEKASEKEFLEVKAATEVAIARMEAERREFIEVTNKIFSDRAIAIQKGLDQITEAYTENDIEHLTKGLNTILSSFGKSLEQSTFQEIDELMRDKSRVLEL